MANGHGGYRAPANPAPTSGPGALSRRTDGGTGNTAAYGDAADMQQIRQGAPLASAPSPSTPGGGSGLDLSQLVGIGEASTQPDTPVTAGAAAGAGPGPEALGLPRDDKQEEARALGQYLPAMIKVANLDNASPAFKRYVRELLANL